MIHIQAASASASAASAASEAVRASLGSAVDDGQVANRVNVYGTCRPVASGGAGGARAPPLFGRSVNPISTRGGTFSPPSIMCPPRFSDLATALMYSHAKSTQNLLED